ncbi:MAG: hypothetical protein KDK36_12250 [Leptospiraceae bacterium]|nr:hypothetical protein [Leptospiraceae bacterium]
MNSIILANTSSPWTLLIDLFFIVTISMGSAWYFYFYKKINFLGGFIGATAIAGLGALLVFAFLQRFVRDLIMWLMSPKLGSVQISNVNLIVVFMGAYLFLYLVQKIQFKKKRDD